MVIKVKKIWPLVLIILIFDAVVWFWILFPKAVVLPELYFLDVGQGDSQMILLPARDAGANVGGGPAVKILIDGGPDASLLANLSKILSGNDHYIDLVMETHPQQDHFGGFIELLKDYEIGAYLHNGRVNKTKSYEELRAALKVNGAPKIVLAAGDRIKYGQAILEILWPTGNDPGRDFNETCLVARFRSQSLSVFYTCDIGASTEKELIQKYDLAANVLKVPHHGSKKSSTVELLSAVRPKIAVIGVGRNPYGHPTKEALSRLKEAGTSIYRTDKDGLIKLVLDRHMESVNIYTEH